MRILSDRLRLRGLSTTTRKAWLEQSAIGGNVRRFFIVTSGYECRSRYWTEEVVGRFKPSETNTYKVYGFKDFEMALSRRKNDSFYQDHGLTPEIVDSDDGSGFVESVVRLIEGRPGAQDREPLELHVDYSCMPRAWYCELPNVLESLLAEDDRAYFWYTEGKYPEADYPTAGIKDFRVFSGRPSLAAGFRTHLFGLGFDRIRSQAIWSILDPQNLVCFYADPAATEEYVARVRHDNESVLASSRMSFAVPMRDFVVAYSRIVGIVEDFRQFGDVVLVPDGPKPLILAASLVPLCLRRQGITCLHVARRRGADFKPVDVLPVGEPTGFSFAGSPRKMPA